MGDAVTKVEIVFTAKDGSAAGLKSVEQAVTKSAAVAAQASEKTATAAKTAATQSVQAAQAAHDQHIRLYRDMAQARETLAIRSERAIQNEIRTTQEAYQVLTRSGAASAREMARAQDATLQRVRELRRELGEVSRMQRLGQVAQGAAAIGAGVMAGNAVIDNPMRSYKDLESAQADLRIAMMRKGGVSEGDYREVMRQAVGLGNRLPGSTKDYASAAMALIEQGMPVSAVIGGGLTAAANFGVLTRMDQYGAATSVAKMREAYGLKDTELPEMANLMQKARFAYGIAPDDFRAVAQYSAPTYNMLGLTGAKAARDLLAVQGMAASVGLENTSFGTNFAMMLQRTSQIDSRVAGKGKEAEEVRALLKEHGIKLNFYDEAGKFAGIENMFKELDKLKPLSDLDRMHVLNKLFGVEAGRPASIMITKGGLAAFNESKARLDEQAEMGPRIQQKTATLASKEEALQGTWENTKAAAAGPLAQGKKSTMDWLNGLLGDTVQPTIEKYPGLGTGAILGGALGAGGAATWASARALQAVMGTGAGLRMLSSIPGITTLTGLASRLPVIPKGAGLFGLGASLGGALLSSVAGEDSATARYGSAALSGAGAGATLGSIVPGVGTVVGGGIGAALGLALQGLTDLLKNPKPSAMKADVTIGLAPGLVVQSQNMTSQGDVAMSMNTGNVWSGAPR